MSKKLRRILSSEGLRKHEAAGPPRTGRTSSRSASVYISPKVDVTPAMRRALAAFKKADPSGQNFGQLRLGKRGSGVELSTYTEGYVKKKIYGQVGTYPSVGGDYNISYQETPDREEELRAMVSLRVTFKDDGKVHIEMDKPSLHDDHRGNWLASETEILFRGRGFGRAASRAIESASETFARWQKKFV